MVPLRRNRDINRQISRDINSLLPIGQAAEMWRAIATQGLNAADFHADASELRGYEWKLTYRPTGQALHASKSLSFPISVAELLMTWRDKDPAALTPVNSSGYVGIVRDWAAKLKADRARQQPLGSGPEPTQPRVVQAEENTPFTPAERAEIAKQLRATRRSVQKNYGLSAEQLSAIDRRLEEAEEASKRLGRKDWKLLFYGAVFGLILNDAVPPDVAQHIFTGVVHGITHLLGGGVPPGPWLLRQ
jgi:hypothetical protein